MRPNLQPKIYKSPVVAQQLYHMYATTRYNFVGLKATHKISPLEELVGGRSPPQKFLEVNRYGKAHYKTFSFHLDWLIFLKSSLKLGVTINCYFVEMMYERSNTKFPYFVLIIQLIWPSQVVLVCDWPKNNLSTTIWPSLKIPKG